MQKMIYVSDDSKLETLELAETLGLPFSRLFIFLVKDYLRNHPEIQLPSQNPPQAMGSTEIKLS